MNKIEYEGHGNDYSYSENFRHHNDCIYFLTQLQS